MFIDIHAHAYRLLPPTGCRFPNACELIKLYDEAGIERGMVLPIVSPEIYYPQSNEDILEMAEQFPDRLIPFCNVDPRTYWNSPESPLDIPFSHYKEKGCKGIGEVMPNMPIMHPMVQNLFRHAEKVGLPVIYDGATRPVEDFGLFDEPGLPGLEQTLLRFPKLTIFGHGAAFWGEITKDVTPGERGRVYNLRGESVRCRSYTPIKNEGVIQTLLRRYPNLCGDLSDFNPYYALTRDPEYGPKFLEEFQDKLFFGTDIVAPKWKFDMIDLLKSWKESGKISKTAFNKIARENAIKLFNLND